MFRVCTPSAVLLILVTIAVPANAQKTLQWRFQPGETLRYVRTQDRVMNTTNAGNTQTQNLNRVTTMTLTVQKVEADGSARIRQTLDRIEYRMKSPAGDVVYDSQNDKGLDGRAAQIAKTMKPLVGADFSFLLTPQGEIKDLQVSEKTRQALKELPPGASETLNDETMKLLVPIVPLPRGDVAAAKNWQQKANLSVANLGAIKARFTFRADGTEKLDGKELARLAISGTASFTPKEGSSVRVEIKEFKSQGKVLIDEKAGRLILRADKNSTRMTVELGARSADQDATSTETLRLVAPERKP